MVNRPTKRRAVVVNDDPTQLGILAVLLGKAKIHARTFESVGAALAAMDPAAPPDLIVTDLHMPGIDGWQFCRLLRSPEYAAFNEVPILVVSATFAGDHHERIAADTGADAFLPSPVDGRQFVAQAQALIEGIDALDSSKSPIGEDSTAGMAAQRLRAEEFPPLFASHGENVDKGHKGAHPPKQTCPRICVPVDPDLADMIPCYLANRKKDVAAIYQALDTNDLEKIRRLSHSMKGSGGGYGFEAISDIGGQMEKAAREARGDDIRMHAMRLEQYLSRVEIANK